MVEAIVECAPQLTHSTADFSGRSRVRRGFPIGPSTPATVSGRIQYIPRERKAKNWADYRVETGLLQDEPRVRSIGRRLMRRRGLRCFHGTSALEVRHDVCSNDAIFGTTRYHWPARRMVLWSLSDTK